MKKEIFGISIKRILQTVELGTFLLKCLELNLNF